MTNREYLTQALTGLQLEDKDIEIILLRAKLDGDARADFVACDLATYERFTFLLKGALHNVSEGGYSISWNWEALKAYYNALCLSLGKENKLETLKRPKVRNRSNLW